MFGLLVKDFCLLAARKQNLLIFFVVCILLGFTSEGAFLVGYMSFLGVLLSLSTISFDEADNGLPFLMTLPVTRRTYAISKYVTGAICCLLFWLASLVLLVLISVTRSVVVEPLKLLLDAILFLPMAMVVLSVMVPLQLKFGAERSRLVLILMFGVCAALVVMGERLTGTTAPTQQVFTFMDAIPQGAFSYVAYALAVVSLAISIPISCRVMANKKL